MKDFIVGSGQVGPEELLSNTHDPHPSGYFFYRGWNSLKIVFQLYFELYQLYQKMFETKIVLH